MLQALLDPLERKERLEIQVEPEDQDDVDSMEWMEQKEIKENLDERADVEIVVMMAAKESKGGEDFEEDSVHKDPWDLKEILASTDSKDPGDQL